MFEHPHQEISYRLAEIMDNASAVCDLITKSSPTAFFNFSEMKNSFITEADAMQLLRTPPDEYAKFQSILSKYCIESFTIIPGNFRVYRRDQLIDAMCYEIRTDSFQSRINRFSQENHTQSVIFGKIADLLAGTGICQTGNNLID